MKTYRQKYGELLDRNYKLTSALSSTQQLNVLLSNYLSNNQENDVCGKLTKLFLYETEILELYDVITSHLEDSKQQDATDILRNWVINKRTDIALLREFKGRK